MGVAMMGTATGDGSTRAIDAARRAISSPLLEDASVNGARGVIVNVTGGPDMSLMEVNEALTIIQEAAHEDANIIFGAVVDAALNGHVKITVIATGFEHTGHGRATSAYAGMQTPVDLQSYTTHLSGRTGDTTVIAPPPAAEPLQPRLTIARRPALELPAAPPARQAVSAAGAEFEPVSDPNADLDLNLELEVPAFLRRSEG
jgi:cell division protein FtsZ